MDQDGRPSVGRYAGRVPHAPFVVPAFVPAAPEVGGGMGQGAVAVVAATAADEARAGAWAARMQVPLLPRSAWEGGAGGAVVVWVDEDGLALRGPAAAGAAPVRPEPPRTRPGGREPLLRAVGAWPDIIDATAGWAGDAGVLAAAGRRVRMIERQPVLAALLADALERWRAAALPAADRLELLVGDALTLLPNASADVVLLDPMYPERGKRARKGEGLHLARALVGGDVDQAALLDVARSAARRRVVVKRPRQAPPLAGLPPSGAFVGRTTRFDIYPPQEART